MPKAEDFIRERLADVESSNVIEKEIDTPFLDTKDKLRQMAVQAASSTLGAIETADKAINEALGIKDPLLSEIQDPVPGKLPIDTSGREAVMDVVLPMIGGTGGAILGAPGGIPGIVSVGALGATLGRTASEKLKGRTSQEALKQGAKEGIIDAAFSLGTLGVSKIAPVRRSLGARTPQARDILEAAQRQNIPLGLVDASERKFVKGAPRVLGVFPFLAGPFQKTAKNKAAAISNELNRKLNIMAPNATLSSLGIDMEKAARGMFVEHRTISGVLYDNFDNLASQVDDAVKVSGGTGVVPTAKIKEKSLELLRLRQRPKLTTGQSLKGQTDEISEFMKQLNDLPDDITVQQLRTIQRDLMDFSGVAKQKGFNTKRISELKESTEQALNDLNTDLIPDEFQAESLIKAKSNADAFYSKSILRFQSPAARVFKRADKNIFDPGPFRPGALNFDEISQSVLNAKSPQAVKGLRSLVGQPMLNKATRAYFNGAKTQATKTVDGEEFFDINIFEKSLGLSGKDKGGREAMTEMLKGSGINIKDIEEFIDVSKLSGAAFIPDPSSFIARRLILGGSVAAAFAIGSTSNDKMSLLTAIPIALLLRKGGRILTDPKVLRNMTRSLKESLPLQQRRVAATRLMRLLIQDNQTPIKIKEKRIKAENESGETKTSKEKIDAETFVKQNLR